MIFLQNTNGTGGEDAGNGTECCASAFWLDWFVGRPLLILGLVIGAFVLRYMVHKLIDALASRAAAQIEVPQRLLGSKRLAKAVSDGSGVYSERRDERALTLASLFKSVSTAVIFSLLVVMVLDTIGIAVGPILASAGILGVALGFGAQNLVKDFLSGVMMMLEDQFGVGDVVDMGEAIGVVEAVSLRITRVRALDGTVWHVRNGEVVRIGNFGQEWARAVLDIGVAYGENTARVRQLLLEVANELAGDPDWGPLILEEPEVWGVQALGADSVVVRVAVKTAPLEQWGVSRELNERIKARFDAEGVEIPFPQRTVWHRSQDAELRSPSPIPSVAGGAESDETAPSNPRKSSARQPEPDVGD